MEVSVGKNAQAVWSEATFKQGIGREPDHAASGLLQELTQHWGMNARGRFVAKRHEVKAIGGEAGLRAEPPASGANGS